MRKAIFVAVLLVCLALVAAASARRPAPTGLVVTGVAHNQVALNWNDYTRFAVTEYRVSRYTPAGSLIDRRLTGSRSSDYTWTGLDPSTTYRFSVTAVPSAAHPSQLPRQVEGSAQSRRRKRAARWRKCTQKLRCRTTLRRIARSRRTRSAQRSVTATTQAAETLTVDLTQPSNGATLQEGSVTLEANATGAAYVEFWVDGTKISQSTTAPYRGIWNATPGNHQVAAVANDGQGRDSVWDGHRVADTHTYTVTSSQTVTSPQPPPPPATHPIPVWEHTLVPAPGLNHSFGVWDTQHTEVYPVGAQNVDKHGVIRWEPGGLYAAEQKTYMLLGYRNIEGSPGRMFNWHTQPADAPFGWTPLMYQGGPSTAVAPLAIDHFGNSGRGLEAVVEPENAYNRPYHFRIMTDAEAAARKEQWIWLWVEIVWGRTGGSTPRQGSLKIWVASEQTPRVNVSGINTHWFGQGMVTFWAGQYFCCGTPGTMKQEIAGPRVGRTPREAYEDNPTLWDHWSDSGGGSWVQRPPMNGNVPVPAALAW
jgi:Bacterial Ig domain/Fibronectin type III domain